MNFEKIIYEIEGHPFVAAIAIFIVLFAGYNLFKKPGTAAQPAGTAQALPTVYETYNQAYNSYPTTPTTPGSIAVSPPQPVPFSPPVAEGVIWIGTATGRLFFGTSQATRKLLSTLFPAGTALRHTTTKIYYTIPGGTEKLYPQTITAHQPK